MSAALLEELIAFAMVAEPAIVEALRRVIADFKGVHPALRDPPPVDGEGAADASGDDAAVRKFHPEKL